MSLYPSKTDNRDIFYLKNEQYILFEFTVFMPLEEIFCFFYYDATQGKYGNHIWNRHQSIKDICNCPYRAYGHIRSDKYSDDIDPTENFYVLYVAAAQIFQTALAVIIPAKNCRKGKKYQTKH